MRRNGGFLGVRPTGLGRSKPATARTTPRRRRELRLESLEPRQLLAADPIISEFMTNNEDSLKDGFGAASDWIELHNPTQAPMDLTGWHLTDDPVDLDKWTFPATSLAPGGYIVVFASGFDTADPLGNPHTNFQLDNDGEYVALVRPDGMTIVSEFGPGGTDFPALNEDISYGRSQQTTTIALVGVGATARMLAPSVGNGGSTLGDAWKGATANEPFADAGWTSGNTGIGYGDFTPPLQVAGELFVDLDADDLTAGATAWHNSGTLGDFARVGNPSVISIEGRRAVQFNATATLDAYQSPTSAPAGLVGANPTRTIETWVFNEGIADEETILAWGKRGGPAGTNMSFNYGANAAFGAIGHWDTPDIGWGVTPTGGTWHHLVYTFDGTTTRVYNDGVMTNSEVLGSGVINTHSGTKITLAAQLEGDGVTLNAALRGTLALGKVRIHDGVLSDSQILNNYTLERPLFPLPPPPMAEPLTAPPVHRYSFNDGTANDSIGTRHGTLTAGATVSGGQVNFAGGGQYVNFAGNDVAALSAAHGAVTIEAWGNYNAATGNWARIYDFGNTNGAAGNNYVFLSPRSGAGTTRAAVSNADPRENLTDGPLTVTSQPVHIVAVYDDANDALSLFINGSLVSSTTMDISLAGVSAVQGFLGKSLFSADAYLNGSIDEFRVYDYALSSNQVLGNYEAGADTVNVVGGSPAAAVEAPPIGFDARLLMQNVSSAAFVRIPFQVADPAAISTLALRMRYDDGFVAYLNGVEIARRNAPATLAWDSAATASRSISEAISPEAFDISAFLPTLRSGTNILAIEGLNISAADNDFLLLPELVATSINTGDDRYFTTPTPGEPNNAGVIGFVADTQFDVDRGFYDAPFDLTISTPTLGATIVYTTDGSEPGFMNGTVVPAANATTPGQAVLHISRTTPLRARAFKPDWEPTDVDTQTYIFLADVVNQSATTALASGFPANWGPNVVDYDVDPDVTTNPAYAATFKNDLKTIPSVSIVIDNDDFFGAANGVYANAVQRGDAWERPTSIEWIDPANPLVSYQENAGLRAFGGVGRTQDRAKHSLRVAFREQYGAAKLHAAIFPDTPVDDHNGLILKMNWNYSWTGDSGGQTQRADYLRDTFGRDTARDLGLPVAKGRPVHVYINGLYWGLYHAIERTDEQWAAETFGGSENDYDVLKPLAETFANTPIEVVAGDRTAWDQLMAASAQNLAVAANYAAVEQMVDVDQLIDYMLAMYYTGSRDAPTLLGTTNEPRNFWAVHSRLPGGKFQFLAWDVEWSLEDVTVDRVNLNYAAGHDNPAMLFSRLSANTDFKQRVADRIRKHFFNDGALTVAASQARYMARANEIDRAIVGESARWGDFLRPAQPYTRNVEWVAERDRLVNSYLAQRTAIVLSQLRTAGLYPAVDATNHQVNGQPNFGGAVLPGASLSISDPNNPVGTIYYTTDGSDPRASVSGSTTTVVLVDSPTTARAFVPKVANGGSLLGTTWTGAAANEPFNDSAWLTNANGPGIGFDTNPSPQDFLPLINNASLATTLRTQMQTAPTNGTVFVRIPFNIASQAAIDALDALTLRMKYDDGFVAYLNGVQIAGFNNPAAPAWNSLATGLHDDNAAVVFQDFNVSQTPQSLLRVGTNILAIHGLNQSAGSSDLLVLPQLVGLDVPSDVSATALVYGGPIAINTTTEVKSRIKRGTTWSALTDATYTVDVPIRITEVNYHPGTRSDAEINAGFTNDDDFEYLELFNTSGAPFDLSGMQFTDGIQLTFGSVTLAPHEYAVVVRNQAAFAFRYGPNVRVIGEYGGTPDDVKLSNSGEVLTLLDAGGGEVQSFRYDDDWYPSTDGSGTTLVILNPLAAKASWNDSAAWRASHDDGGSPGDADFIRGDFDRDNDVDLSDAAFLQSRLGVTTIAGPAAGDLDRNGTINRADAAQLARQFGRTFSPPAGSPSAPAALIATAPAISRRMLDSGERHAVSVARRDRGTRIRLAADAVDQSIDELTVQSSLSAVRRRSERP